MHLFINRDFKIVAFGSFRCMTQCRIDYTPHQKQKQKLPSNVKVWIIKSRDQQVTLHSQIFSVYNYAEPNHEVSTRNPRTSSIAKQNQAEPCKPVGF